MKKLSSDFAGFAKKGFPLIWLIVFVAFVIFSMKGGMFYLLLPIVLVFFVGFAVRFIWMWKKVVDFYVDHEKQEILLDNLMGKKHQYKFSQLTSVKHKSGYTKRVTVTFSDKKSFTFFTKDLWLFELATKEGFNQNIRQELRQIQLRSFEA